MSSKWDKRRRKRRYKEENRQKKEPDWVIVQSCTLLRDVGWVLTAPQVQRSPYLTLQYSLLSVCEHPCVCLCTCKCAVSSHREPEQKSLFVDNYCECICESLSLTESSVWPQTRVPMDEPFQPQNLIALLNSAWSGDELTCRRRGKLDGRGNVCVCMWQQPPCGKN